MRSRLPIYNTCESYSASHVDASGATTRTNVDATCSTAKTIFSLVANLTKRTYAIMPVTDVIIASGDGGALRWGEALIRTLFPVSHRDNIFCAAKKRDSRACVCGLGRFVF